MKIFQAPSYDRFCLLDLKKEDIPFKCMKEELQLNVRNEQADNVTISEEGMNALREKLKEIKPEEQEIIAYELTTQNTNEVEWEHYMTMRNYSSQSLESGDYDLEEVMQSVMDAYEKCYDKILKEHENGDRNVSYDLIGESTVTLEEDLAGLEKAYHRQLANLAGYIVCQQTNDGAKFFNSTDMQKDAAEHKEYKDTAVSIMEEAQKTFLELRNTPDYKEGIAKQIIRDMIKNNPDFLERTQTLFAKTIR